MIQRTLALVIFSLILSGHIVLAVPGARIVQISGEVKVRRGVEETWQPAALDMLLDNIDTILTLEGGDVVLEIPGGPRFRLGSNAILDIADLRKITEHELFLYLTSEKINQIPARNEKTRLQIGNVSVIHGTLHKSQADTMPVPETPGWIQETNGAKALYVQEYYPNTVIKLHNIIKKYSKIQDCGELHFYLGKAFEAMNKAGQALEAYQAAIESGKNCEESRVLKWRDEAQAAIKRLTR